MKKLLLVLLTGFLAFTASSQIYQKVSTWEEMLNRFRVTGMLRPPLKAISNADTGSIYYDSVSKALQIWNGAQWSSIGNVKRLGDTALIIDGDTLAINQGGGTGTVDLSQDRTDTSLTITPSGGGAPITLPKATPDSAGVISARDKQKVDSVWRGLPARGAVSKRGSFNLSNIIVYPGQSVISFGNSLTAPAGSYANLFANYLGGSWINLALGGSCVPYGMKKLNQTSYMNRNRKAISTWMYGVNDIPHDFSPAGLRNLIDYAKLYLCVAFMDTIILSDNMTYSGTWSSGAIDTSGTDVRTPTKKTTEYGASASFYVYSDNVFIVVRAEPGSSSITEAVTIRIDGKEVITTSLRDKGFNNSYGGISGNEYPFLFFFPRGKHKIELYNFDPVGRSLFIDYAGWMKRADSCAPALLISTPHVGNCCMNGAKWSDYDSVYYNYLVMADTFKLKGYPVAVVNPNRGYDPETMTIDGVHANTAGNDTFLVNLKKAVTTYNQFYAATGIMPDTLYNYYRDIKYMTDSTVNLVKVPVDTPAVPALFYQPEVVLPGGQTVVNDLIIGSNNVNKGLTLRNGGQNRLEFRWALDHMRFKDLSGNVLGRWLTFNGNSLQIGGPLSTGWTNNFALRPGDPSSTGGGIELITGLVGDNQQLNAYNTPTRGADIFLRNGNLDEGSGLRRNIDISYFPFEIYNTNQEGVIRFQVDSVNQIEIFKDSIRHYLKSAFYGKVSLHNVDSTNTPTGGLLYIDYNTKDIKLTAIPSGVSASQVHDSVDNARAEAQNNLADSMASIKSRIIGSLAVINDANFTLPDSVSSVVYHNTLTATRTLTIPAASAFPKREISIMVKQLASNSFVISSVSTIYMEGTIGSTSPSTNTDYYKCTLKSDGTYWYMIR